MKLEEKKLMAGKEDVPNFKSFDDLNRDLIFIVDCLQKSVLPKDIIAVRRMLVKCYDDVHKMVSWVEERAQETTPSVTSP